MPAIGHQLRSVLSPPMRTIGSWPWSRLSISWKSSGLIAPGTPPAWAGMLRYSRPNPTNQEGIAAPRRLGWTVKAIGALVAPQVQRRDRGGPQHRPHDP